MKLLSYLFRMGGLRVLFITAMGIVNGLVGTGFIVLINHVLHDNGKSPVYVMIALFVCLAIARLASNLSSQWILVGFAQEKTLNLCDVITRRVVVTPLLTLERIGSARILSTLTEDVVTLSSAILAIPSLIGSLTILAGCLIYLAYLSWLAALVMFVVTVFGAACYKLLLRKAFKAIQTARIGRDTLFGHFRSLTEGVKEIKMSTARQTQVIEQEIGGTARYLRKANMTATFQYLIVDGWSQAMFCLIMGMLLFALPALRDVTLPTLTGYALVALYAMTPVWGILNSIPTFHRGQAALERIESLGFSLAASDGEEVSLDPHGTMSSGAVAPSCISKPAPHIELDRVSFSYKASANGQDNFALGPISLTLDVGHVIFVIGGNGSGKTTLIKLLAGLYSPDSGEIRVEGRPVPGDSQSYRQLFSVVFCDFFIFDRLPGADKFDLDARAKTYLELLQLEKKVHIEGGVFSTTALSQGQRRRLALLSAYLEDRPVYIFDEWAADQDPAYKQVFYAHLLPELKRRGKTVVVITHDDRYFRFGDLIVKLDCGNIVDSWRPAERDSEIATQAMPMWHETRI